MGEGTENGNREVVTKAKTQVWNQIQISREYCWRAVLSTRESRRTLSLTDNGTISKRRECSKQAKVPHIWDKNSKVENQEDSIQTGKTDDQPREGQK